MEHNEDVKSMTMRQRVELNRSVSDVATNSESTVGDVFMSDTDTSNSTLEEYTDSLISCKLPSVEHPHCIRRKMSTFEVTHQSVRDLNSTDESAVDLSHDREIDRDVAEETLQHIWKDADAGMEVKHFDTHIGDQSDIDNFEKTQELLRHYLENADSVDDMPIYKWRPTKHIVQLLAHMVNLLHFLVLIFTSKAFWNTAIVVMNVVVSVFLYLVLACSTIVVTVILNTHEAFCSIDRGKVGKKELKFDEADKITDDQIMT